MVQDFKTLHLKVRSQCQQAGTKGCWSHICHTIRVTVTLTFHESQNSRIAESQSLCCPPAQGRKNATSCLSVFNKTERRRLLSVTTGSLSSLNVEVWQIVDKTRHEIYICEPGNLFSDPVRQTSAIALHADHTNEQFSKENGNTIHRHHRYEYIFPCRMKSYTKRHENITNFRRHPQPPLSTANPVTMASYRSVFLLNLS